MGADSLNGKLKCADCGTTLLEIPSNAQEHDFVRCSRCLATLGTWVKFKTPSSGKLALPSTLKRDR